MELLKIIITAIAIPFGIYMLRSISEVRKELNDHKIYVARNYLTTETLSELKKEIREMRSDLKNDFHKALDNLKQNKN